MVKLEPVKNLNGTNLDFEQPSLPCFFDTKAALTQPKDSSILLFTHKSWFATWFKRWKQLPANSLHFIKEKINIY